MSVERTILKGFSWSDCCPWLVMFRTVTLATRARTLLLGALGLLLTTLGWWVANKVFVDEELREEKTVFALRADAAMRLPIHGPRSGAPEIVVPSVHLFGQKYAIDEPVLSTWKELGQPFYQLFHTSNGTRELAYYLFGGLWTLAVWSFFGGAICRIATASLAREEHIGLGDAIAFARRKWLSHIIAPLVPLWGILILWSPSVVCGWIMNADVGVVLGGLYWPLALLTGLIMALLGIGLFFGWPLMWGTIASEGSDSFDALSRAYAYTFQRPLKYFLYVLLAIVLGILGWVIVTLFAETVIHMCYWATGWGAGFDRINANEIAIAATTDSNQSGAFVLGSRIIYFWNGCVRVLAAAFSYSFFFVAMTGVYLLLRRDVDQTELDEVYFEEDDEISDLPPLTPPREEEPERSEGTESTDDDNDQNG
jgi:hypothetical protein